jgi:hypothetical protein
MVRPPRVRPARLMQGKGEEDQAADAIERRIRRGRGGHSDTEGVAAGQEHEVSGNSVHRCNCRTDDRRAHVLGVSPAAVLHVREVEAKGRHARFGYPLSDCLESRVSHVRAGPMAQQEEVAGVAGAEQQGREVALLRRGEKIEISCCVGRLAAFSSCASISPCSMPLASTQAML